jgi:hypothetical protein
MTWRQGRTLRVAEKSDESMVQAGEIASVGHLPSEKCQKNLNILHDFRRRATDREGREFLPL